MKFAKTIVLTGLGYALISQQALAEEVQALVVDNGIRVPEIDGGSAALGIGLVVGLVALFREKFFRK